MNLIKIFQNIKKKKINLVNINYNKFSFFKKKLHPFQIHILKNHLKSS